MMLPQVRIENAGKRFQQQWLFKNLDLEINKGDRLAITGYNGSGKSTLLQVIAGYQSLSTGTISFAIDGYDVTADHWYKKISCATPYLDFPDELSLLDNVKFFSFHKPFKNNLAAETLIEIAQLREFKNKPVKYFSSGMKQRLRLALTFYADVPFLLLDEPLSNLDRKGTEWFNAQIELCDAGQTIIICSNHQAAEIVSCTRIMDLAELAEKNL